MAPPRASTPARGANPLKNRPPIKAPAHLRNNSAKKPRQKLCPNKTCNSLEVEDGICTECGTVIEEVNIVSEVQFGETSSGAAMVQGTYIGADQGGAITTGPGGRGDGFQASRNKSLGEGKEVMERLQAALGISPNAVTAGANIFRLARDKNFIQGRRIQQVAGVCLYTACRQIKPCRVMLIDFADKLNVNVFKLGAVFRALAKAIPTDDTGVMPILPEDLIHRFASKLEFDDLCDKVAEDAVRLVKRMSLDWMVMGRRPSGVCGACLILAARMNNFRRAITEVVYVVKVTTHTIQKRLEEFKMTPSSALTVEEFLHNEFLESAHDPPSFYEKTEEFQKTKKKRKRKAVLIESYEEISDDEASTPNKRPKSTAPPDQNVELRRDADGFAIPPVPNQTTSLATSSDPDANIDPSLRTSNTSAAITQPESVTQSTDAPQLSPTNHSSAAPSTQPDEGPSPATPSEQPDHSTSPPSDQPSATQASDTSTSAEIPEEFLDDQAEQDVEKLVRIYGDSRPVVDEDEDDNEEEDEDEEEINPRKGKKGPDNRPIRVTEGWDQDEQILQSEITEIINDPNTTDHADAYAIAKQRAIAHVLTAARDNPQKEVSMDVHIGEDEFKDDPEVINCLLSREDSLHKEKIWVNENRDWLRKQQLRECARKQAELEPPKIKRNRIKKARMGEGQTAPAASPAEAVAEGLKRRQVSRRINYGAVDNIFDDFVMGGALGSAATSRVTSQAGSEIGSEAGSRASSVAPSSRRGSVASDFSPLDMFTPKPNKRTRERSARSATPRDIVRASPVPRLIAPRPSAEPESVRSTPAPDADDDELGDASDYRRPTPPPAPRQEEVVDDWRAAIKQAKIKDPNADGEEEEPEDESGYDMGGIEPGGLGDFDDDGDNARDDEDDGDDGGFDGVSKDADMVDYQ